MVHRGTLNRSVSRGPPHLSRESLKPPGRWSVHGFVPGDDKIERRLIVPEVPIHGISKGADGIIRVRRAYGKVDVEIECLCHFCYELEQGGVEAYDSPEDLEHGDHYVSTWATTYQGGPWGPEEHDGGMELHRG